MCLDPYVDAGHPNTRFHNIAFFSGAPRPANASERLCFPAEGYPGGRICDGDKIAHIGSLNHNNFILGARVLPGTPASNADRIGGWLEGHLVPVSRHYTSNLAHSISDDIWPLWKLARHQLGWDPAQAPTPAGAAATLAPSTVHAVFVDYNTLGTGQWLRELYRLLLPGMHVGLPVEVGRGATRKAPLVCARGVGLVGIGGQSRMRNAEYGFHKQWTFANDHRDWAGQRGDWRDFVARYRAAYGLQQLESVPRGGAGDRARRIILVNRGGAVRGSDSRTIDNMGDVAAAVRGVAGGRPVEMRDWKDHPEGDNVAAADDADVVVGIHGAGHMMMLAARPGAAWLELMPPRAWPVTGIYRAMAARQRLGYHMQTLWERSCDPSQHFHMQPSFTADAVAVAAHVGAILAQQERGGATAAMAAAARAAPQQRVAAVLAALPPKETATRTGAALAAGLHAAAASGAVPARSAWPVPTDVRPTCAATGVVCGGIVILSPVGGPRRIAGGVGWLVGALTGTIAMDNRPHMSAHVDEVRSGAAAGAPGSPCGEGRNVSVIAVPVDLPPPALASLLGAVGRAEMVIAPHGTGLAPLMAALAPGGHWVDLAPPRAHGRHVEYYAPASAGGVALHTLMSQDGDCNADVYAQDAYAVDPIALAALVALELRAEE